tara:strand:- start:90 stop:422 length:333 start_codon:yes stop_codon:yes gene_type:complete
MSSEWKATERYVAAALGGTRIPVNGRGDTPDVEHPDFSIEVKRRSSAYAFPKWLEKAFLQAKAAISDDCNDGTRVKIPLVVVEHAQGRGKPKQHYVMLTLNDFAELVNDE